LAFVQRKFGHQVRTFVFLVLSLASMGAFAGGSSTNQSEMRVFISSVRGGRPVVRVEQGKPASKSEFFRFSSKTCRQWQTNYSVCSKALVDAAEKKHLDSLSLAKILQNLRAAPENKNLAILPVAAHSTRSDGELVWVVALRWEGESWVAKSARLDHLRFFTITQQTLKQLAFSTCE